MSESIRIRTEPNGGDKYIKIKLEQDFDFIEVLSLKLTQEEAYRKFSSDYGVVTGRVILNSGFGVPFAKVSIFIPIDEADKEDPIISGLYPYETLTDKNDDGVRYNLLSKTPETNNDCFTPIGTFPNKREVLDQSDMANVYCKYYKYTSTTNHAGDFMIFGVPIGTHTLHVDADISDIGIISQRPYDLISQGTPEKFFDSPTKFKYNTNLDSLVQVKTANVGVNVLPFWGDLENYEIGITRVDVDLNHTIIPTAIFMGSIFGDQDKHSINKICRPRKKLGELCEQVTGTGSIEIIRKTIDGGIEEFDVDGGRLIDEDGTWAFQIPMNLDYVVTDEFGRLIPSNDPNIGVATRASVRFRIGMDETGGEGRLRTRAKYLVPNNPDLQTEIDYEFGSDTKDSSFRDLYWDKIYSVSNFISRFQRRNSSVNSRNITAIKDVDACAGEKTPFPYNKVATSINPIFFIICLVIKMIGFMIYIMNLIILPIINFVIGIIRTIIDILNGFPFNAGISQVDYLSCLTVRCPSDDGALFAPGCNASSRGFSASSPQPNYYCGDNDGHTCNFVDLVGLDDCMAFEMANSLDLFKFDFYNDWVTGSLFGYLLKYKKRRNGRERFCEFDCSDFSQAQTYSGVDGNENGVPDNDCYNHMLMDTCYPCLGDDCQKENRNSNVIREGLIKKFNGELYYAATTHNAALKLFATDITCLGSIFDCDWQGVPKLQPYLVPSTYKIPPDIQEKTDNGTQLLETGMVDIGGNTLGLLFSVNCSGIHVNNRQCLNIRHMCEVFVDIDEATFDQLNNNIVQQADGILGGFDVDDSIPTEFRDTYLILNSGSTFPLLFNIPTDFSSDFNPANCAIYDFTSSVPSPCNPTLPSNGVEYLGFRGYPVGDNIFSQPKHSYFMYFGLNAGKTALDKMNQRFFTPCQPKETSGMLLEANAVPDSGNTFSGEITFTYIGGHGSFTYTISGPNGYNISGNTIIDTVEITGLEAGTYVIVGVDSVGFTATQTVVVTGPTPLYCSVSVTKNVTSILTNDGEITINAIGGGVAPYSFIVKDYQLNVVGNPSYGINALAPITINGLGVDDQFGYIVQVADSGGNSCTTSGLTISGPTAIGITATPTNVTCFNGTNGEIHLDVSGGNTPYFITTTGPAGYQSNSANMSGLGVGTYVTNVVDDLGTTATLTSIISSIHPQLTISAPSASELGKQCDTTQYHIPFYITAGIAPNSDAYVEYLLDNQNTWNYATIAYSGPTDPLVLSINKTDIISEIRIRFSDSANHECHSNVLTFNVAAMQLPLVALSGQITRSGQGPYTYVITANGGVGVLTGSPFVIGNNGPIGAAAISTVITDSVGCSIVINS